MKASQIILEEYQKTFETFGSSEDVLYSDIDALSRLTQAYKDALYMEGEIEKVEEKVQPYDCEHSPDYDRPVEPNRSFRCLKCDKEVFRVNLDWIKVKS